MRGFITTCFCDWNSESFANGVMRIVGEKRTDYPLRRPLKPEEKEGVDYYIKADPNFREFTYSKCHRGLRKTLKAGDVLFFRTLWRGKPYIIGYFVITHKTGSPENPACHAYSSTSRKIDFNLEITPEIVKLLNRRAKINNSRHFNKQVNEWLGRNYLEISEDDTKTLMLLICLIDVRSKNRLRK